MTAPDKIWTAPTDGKCHVGFDTKSMNYTIEYTRTDLAQAAVAAAYEAAAHAIEKESRGIRLAEAVAYRMEDAAAKKTAALILGSLGRISVAIRALATPDQIAALAAERAATVMVKPLVWEELEQDRGDGTTDLTGDHEAVSCVGVYSIALSFGSDSYYWSVALNADEIGHSFDDLGYAKAAAQADYDARIRSAIIITSGADRAEIGGL